MTGAVAEPYHPAVIIARGSRPLRGERLAVLLVAASLVTAACNATPSSTPTPSPTPEVSTPASSEPSGSSATPTSPGPATSPTPSPSPGESSAGSASPSPGSSTAPLPNPNPAAACSGSDRNRDFFAAVAQAVDWDVYCAVLPGGWYVDQGTYRLAGGGRLEIAYTGPGGARFELREGAFCSDASGCVPPGTEAGEAVFGNRRGTLVELTDGGWAVVVDRGARISWLAVGVGLERDAFLDLAARLALVAA